MPVVEVDLQKLKQEFLTPIWSDEHGLPLVPEHNNPWIYMAYAAYLTQKGFGCWIDRRALDEYFAKCSFGLGLFHRYPKGVGGRVSYDEIIGFAAVMDFRRVGEMMMWLDRRWGYFNNERPRCPDMGEFIRCNIYRLIFMRGYLGVMSERRICFSWHILWAVSCLLDGLFGKDSGGHLRFWLMAQGMRSTFLGRITHKIWCKFLQLRRINLRSCFGDEIPDLNFDLIPKQITFND